VKTMKHMPRTSYRGHRWVCSARGRPLPTGGGLPVEAGRALRPRGRQRDEAMVAMAAVIAVWVVYAHEPSSLADGFGSYASHRGHPRLSGAAASPAAGRGPELYRRGPDWSVPAPRALAASRSGLDRRRIWRWMVGPNHALGGKLPLTE